MLVQLGKFALGWQDIHRKAKAFRLFKNFYNDTTRLEYSVRLKELETRSAKCMFERESLVKVPISQTTPSSKANNAFIRFPVEND